MKPMLLSNDEYDLDNLNYTNMFISKKRDGVRAEVSNKGILGRSLKTLPNFKLQEYFKEIYSKLPDDVIIEAEVCAEELPCRTIAGICNSKDKDIPSNLKLYIFGLMNDELTFEERIEEISKIMKNIKSSKYHIVNQMRIKDKDSVLNFYNQFIKDGYEGAVLMNSDSMYKHGRVTIKQHIGFKLKPSREDDLEIIGVTERFENLNESLTNELGHSYKRNTVDAKESTGIAATFICKLPNGETTKVTITGDEAFRREIWNNQHKYIGRYATVKSMDYGTKDKLRHPRLIDIKNDIEK